MTVSPNRACLQQPLATPPGNCGGHVAEPMVQLGQWDYRVFEP